MNPTGQNTDVTMILHAGWLTSPVTNLRPPVTTLVPNHALRGAVTAYTAGILGRSTNPNR